MEIKIPSQYPQFEDKKVFVVVCGGLEARVYEGRSGVLTELFHVRAPEIHYTDKETRFVTRVKGFITGMGAIMKQADKKEEDEFFNKFGKMMEEAAKKEAPEVVYVFAPSYAVPKTLENIPAAIRNKVVVVAKGNYLDKHPTEVLEMMKNDIWPE